MYRSLTIFADLSLFQINCLFVSTDQHNCCYHRCAVHVVQSNLYYCSRYLSWALDTNQEERDKVESYQYCSLIWKQLVLCMKNNGEYYTCQLVWRKCVRFSSGFVESLRSYLKMPKNLMKIYEDNLNVSEDIAKIFRSWSQDIVCQAQPLLIQKSENIPLKNCHLCTLFNLLLVWVQITC